MQVPAAISVTVLPLSEHTESVNDESATASPDDATAATANGDAANVRLEIGPKVIVWPACATAMTNDCVAEGLTPLLAVMTPM